MYIFTWFIKKFFFFSFRYLKEEGENLISGLKSFFYFKVLQFYSFKNKHNKICTVKILSKRFLSNKKKKIKNTRLGNQTSGSCPSSHRQERLNLKLRFDTKIKRICSGSDENNARQQKKEQWKITAVWNYTSVCLVERLVATPPLSLDVFW